MVSQGEVLNHSVLDFSRLSGYMHYICRRSKLISDIDMNTSSASKSEVDLARYICPVFSRLINYYCDENICKILVDSVLSVPNGCQQVLFVIYFLCCEFRFPSFFRTRIFFCCRTVLDILAGLNLKFLLRFRL